MRGLELNTSLTLAYFEWILDEDDDDAITYYTKRNKLCPQLIRASKAERLPMFENILAEHDCGLSVVFEALRTTDDWF